MDTTRFFYRTRLGRLLLKGAYRPKISRLAGRFLDSRMSKPLAKRYLKRYNINTSEYYGAPYRTFNSCFTRKIHEDRRPFSKDPGALISPCDGYLSVYRVESGTVFPVKQSSYTLKSLLKDDSLAARFENGLCLVFRLNVDNYHRYCYVDRAVIEKIEFIPGYLHSVRPTALEKYPVFVENCREYTVMETENFGTVVQVEVGALLVGKIKNYLSYGVVDRGEEKGLFEYGGSTIILLFENDRIIVDESLITDTALGKERPVKLGETVARRVERPGQSEA